MAGEAITIKFDKRQLRDLERTLADFPKEVPKVMRDTVNETAKTVNSRIVKGVDLALPQKDLRPPRSGGTNKLSGWNFNKVRRGQLPVVRINLPDKNISLVHYKHTVSKRGVSVKVRKSRGREKYRHGFKARGRRGRDGASGGAEQLWFRKVQGGQPVGRLPIAKLTGPSVADVLRGKPGFLSGIVNEIPALMAKRAAQQVERVLAKKRG